MFHVISNSIRFSNPGGSIKIWFEINEDPNDRKLLIGNETREVEFMTIVRDEGQGLKEKTLELLEDRNLFLNPDDLNCPSFNEISNDAIGKYSEDLKLGITLSTAQALAKAQVSISPLNYIKLAKVRLL